MNHHHLALSTLLFGASHAALYECPDPGTDPIEVATVGKFQLLVLQQLLTAAGGRWSWKPFHNRLTTDASFHLIPYRLWQCQITYEDPKK